MLMILWVYKAIMWFWVLINGSPKPLCYFSHWLNKAFLGPNSCRSNGKEW
jgi:hypothetical protein